MFVCFFKENKWQRVAKTKTKRSLFEFILALVFPMMTSARSHKKTVIYTFISTTTTTMAYIILSLSLSKQIQFLNCFFIFVVIFWKKIKGFLFCFLSYEIFYCFFLAFKKQIIINKKRFGRSLLYSFSKRRRFQRISFFQDLYNCCNIRYLRDRYMKLFETLNDSFKHHSSISNKKIVWLFQLSPILGYNDDRTNSPSFSSTISLPILINFLIQ